MAATAHISVDDLERALERARAGEDVVLDGGDELFRVRRGEKKAAATWNFADLGPFRTERTDFRPLDEILADPNIVWSDAVMDDQWGSDMDTILAENRAHDRDPWAE